MKKLLLLIGALMAWIIPANAATDVLTASKFDVSTTGTSYSDHTYDSDVTSAKYSANCANNSNSFIQLRSSKNNSGIVSTVSGGTLKSVKITWGTGNGSGRTVDIYGSNTAYTAPSALYTTATAGTKVAGLNVNNAVNSVSTFTFEDNYEYIGIRSNSGALYISEIEIEWGSGATTSVAAPTFSPDGGIVAKGTNITINTETGLTVYYTSKTDLGSNTIDAENVFGSGIEGTSFIVNASETYYAVAMDANDDFSKVVSAEFIVLQHAGTATDPLDVVDASVIANYQGTTPSTESYYVKGYVATQPTFSSSKGTLGFYITDAENLEGAQVQVYGLLADAEGGKFSSANDVEIGDLVVVCAPIQLYNGKPETNGGYLVNKTSKEDPELAWNEAEFTWEIGITKPNELPTLSFPAGLTINYKSSVESVATISATGEITIVGDGTTVIEATSEPTSVYKSGVATYTLIVVDPTKIENILNANNLGIEGSYGQHSATFNGITYEVYANKNSGIQFNPKNNNVNSGIVITGNTNNYAIKSIEIDVRSMGTVDLLVIGSNEAYTGVSQIGAETLNDSRESLGTVLLKIQKSNINDSSTKFTINPTDNYKYLCICPANKFTASSGASAIVLNSITINWMPGDVDVTIGETGYSTLYYGDRALKVPAGISAWTFSANGSDLVATESYHSLDVIPAGEAVVLYTESQGNYVFSVAEATTEAVEGNCLKGTDATQPVTATGTPYILAVGSAGIGFYQAAPDGGKAFTNNAHKAYLEVPASQNAPARILLNFGSESGLNCIMAEPTFDGQLYNVLGQPVDRNYKGVIISNGKKIFNK